MRDQPGNPGLASHRHHHDDDDLTSPIPGMNSPSAPVPLSHFFKYIAFAKEKRIPKAQKYLACTPGIFEGDLFESCTFSLGRVQFLLKAQHLTNLILGQRPIHSGFIRAHQGLAHLHAHTL